MDCSSSSGQKIEKHYILKGYALTADKYYHKGRPGQLKLLIDGKNLTNQPSGIGRYIEFMVNALLSMDMEIHIAAPCELNKGYRLDPRVQIHISRQSLLPIFLSWRLFNLPDIVKNEQPSIIWGPAHRLPFFLPKRVKSILTIHDMVWREKRNTMKLSTLMGEFLFMPRSLTVADKIITVSDSTKHDLLSYRPELSAKISTIACGGAALSKEKERPPELTYAGKFILSVGTIEPRKNFENCVKAFLEIPLETRKDYKYVIAGRKGWKKVKLPESDDIIFIEGPNENQLAWLYQNCKFVETN